MPTKSVTIAAVVMERRPSHVRGKQQIFNWAQAQGWQPQMEVYLSEIAQRPDVLAQINGQPVALEFQCSPLSVQRLQERNDGYHRLGIAVYWLLGPTYYRHLRGGMVSQFTQLCASHPQLAFWRLDRQQIEFRQNYYQPVLSRHMANTADLLLHQTQTLQRHMRYRDRRWRSLVNQAYLNGHQLSACPLVAHPLVPQWPLLDQGELYWRLRIILKMTICQPGMTWQRREWDHWLIQQGRWWPTPCLTEESRQRMIQKIVDQFTSDLLAAGVVRQENDHLCLKRQPRWFDDDAVKVKYLLQRNK